MKNKCITILFLFTFGSMLGTSIIITTQTYISSDSTPLNCNFQNLKLSEAKYSNVTVISDGYGGLYRNDDNSFNPEITVDNSGNIHVVWEDNTDGAWGIDSEIVYASYTNSTGWSNFTVISDGYNGIYWNDGNSYHPEIAVDDFGGIHVVWEDQTDGIWGGGMLDSEIMYASYTEAGGWSNVTVISDGYGGIYWNDGYSNCPDIAIDNSGNIHVVWEDNTDGVWGIDSEIMYASYTKATEWSFPKVISDGYRGLYWNDEDSDRPSITVDDFGGIHIVWEDQTDGVWGMDWEIMYISYTEDLGWSNITVISDGYGGLYWNDGFSNNPDIAVDDSGSIHVVWSDETDGVWGIDTEVMYTIYTKVTGWSFPKVISDGYNSIYWNDDISSSPDIAVDDSGSIHVVWYDYTDGVWGIDSEIMYVSYTGGLGWSNASIISDGYRGLYWNDGNSYHPDIAVDDSGSIHVVWYDGTDGVWGTDYEIMFTSALSPSTKGGDLTINLTFILLIISIIEGIALVVIISTFFIRKRKRKS